MKLRDVKPNRPPRRGGGAARLLRRLSPAAAGSGPTRPAGPRLAGGLGFAVVAVLGVALFLARGEAQDEAIRTVRVPSSPPPVVERDTLGTGQTLAALLDDRGFDPAEIETMVRGIREYENPRRLRAGTEVRFRLPSPSERPAELALRLDRDRTIRVRRADGGWETRLDSVPVSVDTIEVAGVIRSSLYGARLMGDTARLAPGEADEIAHELSRIFQWQVDFFRDLRPGDAFRLTIARQVRPDGSVRRARVLGAEFVNDGRRLSAIWFDAPDPEVRGYYDRQGNSLQTMFLRAPLNFPVTSGFSRRRYHPVLHRRTAHRGLDYGAPYGARVRATGAGVVTRAARWGGYGRMVEVRHSGRYRTRYAHLSSIARGVHAGARVEQGETIGRVGATGLATGAHLHYEFLVNGSQRNPAALELPPGDPVPKRFRDEFRTRKNDVVALLEEVSLPGGPQLTSSEDLARDR